MLENNIWTNHIANEIRNVMSYDSRSQKSDSLNEYVSSVDAIESKFNPMITYKKGC